MHPAILGYTDCPEHIEAAFSYMLEYQPLLSSCMEKTHVQKSVKQNIKQYVCKASLCIAMHIQSHFHFKLQLLYKQTPVGSDELMCHIP